ncbi:MAG: bifunctional folylpolyglutamate synthase/dihydrofolate synthase [Gemmataceae bacterium]
MTYAEAIAWWYGRVDFERRAPQPGDLKLDQIRALLRAVGDPQQRLRIVHVAGSKGKGSTAAMLAAVLRAAGYRTGLFTSPHLSAVEERIQVDHQPISPAELALLLTEIRDRLPAVVTPTFFEVGTAAGFLHFVRRRVDAAVVEVGLGGRFDSTNVCTPLLAVITSISHDHTKLLGDRLSQIAFEKAGIVKPGVPVVSGADDGEAAAVIERIAAERRAPLALLGRDFSLDYEPGRAGGRLPRAAVRTKLQTWPALEIGLLGRHQAANAAVAVSCVEHLRQAGLTIPDAAVAAGLAGVRWPARLEVLGRAPWVVLDCAHNIASARAMVETIAESFSPRRKFLVFAVSSDKDVPGMLRELAPHFDGFYLTRFGQNVRAVPPEQLAAWLADVADVPRLTFPSAADAWRAARAAAGPDDLVAVSGSVFLAGELRPLIAGE